MINLGQLKFAYKRKTVLFEQLNAKMDSGKIYGLLGHNGAGKTTMLKLIAGLLFPKSGFCNVLGFKPEYRNPNFIKDIYYIPEEFEFPAFSIEKYLKIHSVFYPDFDKVILNEILNEFDLSYESKLTTLSFGQKKKFLLAFAIATKCRILLMDEPTNGLDIPSKSKLRQIIAKYITDERSFIISTHQVRDLDNILDSVIVIERGQVIFSKSIEEIQQKLVFKKVKSLDDNKDILYSSRELGGFNVLTKNIHTEETKIDLETLYNAINTNKELVNNAFN